MSDILLRLEQTIRNRRTSDPADSYVSSLQRQGINRILEKIGEEATETIIAAKDASVSGKRGDLIHEIADLWFHTMVMADHLDVSLDSILEELERRFGTSGLAEKKSRSESNAARN